MKDEIKAEVERQLQARDGGRRRSRRALAFALLLALFGGNLARAQQSLGFSGAHQMSDLFRRFFTWNTTDLQTTMNIQLTTANSYVWVPSGSGGVYYDTAGSRHIFSDSVDILVNDTFVSQVGSGTNAFGVQTNGARYDFGAGASDYASSDGTTVTFAGPVAVTSSISSAAGAGGTLATVGGFQLSTNKAIYFNGATQTIYAYGDGTNLLLNALSTGAIKGNVGANVDTSNIGGTVNVTTADVTSSGASNLISYTLPANALIVTNRCLRITGWGTALNNANAKTVALDVGSQTVITKQLTISIATETWKLEATVCRSGSSTQDIYAEAWNSGGITVSSTDGPTVLYQAARTAGTQTETATIVIKGKTTTATTTDVTMDGLTVEYL